jgi:hypothetical protein
LELLNLLSSMAVAIATTWLTLWLFERREQERRALRMYAAELQALTTLMPVFRQEQPWRPTTPETLFAGANAGSGTAEMFRRVHEKNPDFIAGFVQTHFAGFLRSQLESELELLIEARRTIHFIRDMRLRDALVGIEVGVRNAVSTLHRMSVANADQSMEGIDEKIFQDLAAALVDEYVANIVCLFRELEDVCWGARRAIAERLKEPIPERPAEKPPETPAVPEAPAAN